MLNWFRTKHGTPAAPQRENFKAVPLAEDKPIHKHIFIASYRSAERSYSVKVVCGFCRGCNPENPKLLATNHVAKLFGCSLKQCAKKLVKVTIA